MQLPVTPPDIWTQAHNLHKTALLKTLRHLHLRPSQACVGLRRMKSCLQKITPAAWFWPPYMHLLFTLMVHIHIQPDSNSVCMHSHNYTCQAASVAKSGFRHWRTLQPLCAREYPLFSQKGEQRQLVLFSSSQHPTVPSRGRSVFNASVFIPPSSRQNANVQVHALPIYRCLRKLFGESHSHMQTHI